MRPGQETDSTYSTAPGRVWGYLGKCPVKWKS